MKAKLFSIILISLISLNSFAQIKLGVRGTITGSTVTKFDLIENITPTFKLTPSAGGALFLEIPVQKNLSFQPELSYTTKGFRVKEGIDVAGDFVGINIPVNGQVDFKTHYLDVPLLAKIHFGDTKKSHYYMLIGPAVGFVSDANMRIRVFNIFPINTSIPKGIFKSAELSGIAALGFEVPFNQKVKLFGEARYQHGFSRTIDTPVIQLPVRNRTYGGGIGFTVSI
jgi:hypothetical protein